MNHEACELLKNILKEQKLLMGTSKNRLLPLKLEMPSLLFQYSNRMVIKTEEEGLFSKI